MQRSLIACNEVNSQQLYHGKKAKLKPGDFITAGSNSNYGIRKKASYVYLFATLEIATWGAKLALETIPNSFPYSKLSLGS